MDTDNDCHDRKKDFKIIDDVANHTCDKDSKTFQTKDQTKFSIYFSPMFSLFWCNSKVHVTSFTKK